MKKLIKNFLRKKGFYLLKEGFMPTGIYFDADLKFLVHLDRFRVAMDVGAYHGWMTDEFLKTFVNAQIITVEPTVKSFEHLTEKYKGNRRVLLQNCAAGSEEATISFRLFDNGQLNSFKQINNDEAVSVDATIVPVHTVTDILQTALPGESGIDFLKIDVEGFEMETLTGAVELMGDNNIGCILIEAGFCDDDERHTPFKTISDMLTKNGFAFYALYDLYHYRKKHELLFANALFLNESYLQKNGLLKNSGIVAAM